MEEIGIRFANPIYLKLLAMPILLLCVWLWRFFSRRIRIGTYKDKRIVSLSEKYLLAGILSLWLCLIFGATFSITALARPQKLMSIKSDKPIDIIVILDGSASMYVSDVKPDRWGRSVKWLKTLIETLPWRGDRVALAAFAHKASPMIRLTSDPNVVMFFIEYMKESPFKLQFDTTWDTNMEEGLYWGVKIFEKDEAINGKRGNPRAFVLVSDGQAWSGDTELMLKSIKDIGPVYVVGVGTTGGGMIPRPEVKISNQYWDSESEEWVSSTEPTDEFPVVKSEIDRESLRNIAKASGGEYFEIGNESDGAIVAKIISRIQRKSQLVNKEELWEDLYWYCLLGAAVFLGLGIYFASR